MRLLIRIAWRNIWRNRSRSLVLLAAIASGVWAGLFLSAIGQGYLVQRFDQVIANELSHVQVHHPGFRAEREPGQFIAGGEQVLEWAEAQPEVRAVAPRLLLDGMIQSPVKSAGVEIRGIEPGAEAATTGLPEAVVAGDYLQADGAQQTVILGQRLAEEMGVVLGNRVVLTFQNPENDLVAEAFHVTGLFRGSSRLEETRRVFVRRSDLAESLDVPDGVHQIAVLLGDVSASDAFAAALAGRFPNAAAETWAELSPEMRYLDEMGNVMTYIMMGVILLALAFGLLNTLMMATFERTPEFGMLIAIGMTRGRVFIMVVLESIMLTVSGALIGLVFGQATNRVLGRTGLDLEPVGGAAMETFGYDTVVYPVMANSTLVGVLALVIVTAILAALWPAWKALKLQPAQAIGAGR